MRFKTFRIAALALALGAAAPVIAETYDFDLTGQVGAGSTSVFTSGGQTFTIFTLDLSGFEMPFQLAIGDVLNLHVTLDGVITVPASTAGTFFGVDALTDPARFALLDDGVISSGSVSPIDGTYAGQTFSSACGNCISATASLGVAPAFQIGELDAAILIESLLPLDPADTSPVVLNGFQFRYQSADLVAEVPEPGIWAMMLLGFGAIGTALRRNDALCRVPHQTA